MTTLVLDDTGMVGGRVARRLASRAQDAAGIASVFAPTSTGAAVVDVAAEHGARRIVLLTERRDEAAVPVELAVREAVAEWTIVRASMLDQIFSEGALRDPVRSGRVALPVPPVGEPFVDAADVADVAVAALTEAGHAGRVYELTGPRLLTFAEAIEEIGAACRRPIHYTRVGPGRTASLPETQAAFLCDRIDGRNARLADGVRRVLGREPRDFADYARAAAAGGAWPKPTTTRRSTDARKPVA
jgi:uncharacterized protein YbjT (DUF2867 family)